MERKYNISITTGMASKRVCVIGGGPGAVGGLEVLHQMASHAKRLPEKERERLPTLVCYEQQASPGEMWNLDWRVGEFMEWIGLVLGFIK